ncbi:MULTISPECIES: putative zinc-binding protein [Xanthobacter]|uniref:putative zinc-binding protein n=1 Tax=Xanthobacter TaxID=279 RepID=UPI0037371019
MDTKAPPSESLPLVYSCSGCSSAAQLANYLAVRLDRLGHAEMSCIAGLGGDIPSLVRLAKAGRSIVAIDGCGLRCVQRTLARHGLRPTVEYELTRLGVKKRSHADFEQAEAEDLLGGIIHEIGEHGAGCSRPNRLPTDQ